MLECKCLKNLSNFATSRPPFVIFTLCLAIFAAGLFSIGFYVQSQDFYQNPKWKSFTSHISNQDFCVFSKNSTIYNSTDRTTPTSYSEDYTQVFLPVILTLSPSDFFDGNVYNVSHITTLIKGQKLGFEGSYSQSYFNMTLLLRKPWLLSCSGSRCSSSVVSACVAVKIPNEIVPTNLPRGMCNSTGLVNMASMSSLGHCIGIHCCYDGILVRASLPKYYKETHEGPSEMGLNDWATVNLRLQYSSYFLFVLAITCILYGMIKGRSMKLSSKKGSPVPSI